MDSITSLVAAIVISLSAVMLIVASPPPALVEARANPLLLALF